MFRFIKNKLTVFIFLVLSFPLNFSLQAQEENPPSPSKNWTQKFNSFVKKEQKKMNQNFKKIEHFFNDVATSFEDFKDVMATSTAWIMEEDDDTVAVPSIEFKCQATFQLSLKVNNKGIFEDFF